MPLSDSVQTALDAARSVYLNDISGATFTNVILLPYIREAYRHLQARLEVNGVQFLNSCAEILVSAGAKALGLPGNFIYPIDLFERASNSTDEGDYIIMEQTTWEEMRPAQNNIGQWQYREGEIKLPPCLNNRLIKLHYQQVFPDLKDGTTLVRGNCISYLAAGTAALAHLFINQNESLASTCKDLAEGQMNEILKIAAKRSQSLTARRLPYRPFMVR